jgi:hypothetical protein
MVAATGRDTIGLAAATSAADHGRPATTGYCSTPQRSAPAATATGAQPSRPPGQPPHNPPRHPPPGTYGEPVAVKAARRVREAVRGNGPVERPAPRLGPTSQRSSATPHPGSGCSLAPTPRAARQTKPTRSDGATASADSSTSISRSRDMDQLSGSDRPGVAPRPIDLPPARRQRQTRPRSPPGPNRREPRPTAPNGYYVWEQNVDNISCPTTSCSLFAPSTAYSL